MAQYNEDELVAPDWLSDEFFQDVVRKAQNDPSVKLCHGCKLRPGTLPGDHYASVMFRTTAHYRSERFRKEQALNLVIKIMPTATGFKAEMLKNSSLFETEIKMYGEVLPAIAKILKDVGERFEFPRLIYGALQPKAIVILEDCNPMGWVAGREYIDSIEEVMPSIHNIAKLHAVSYFLNQQMIINLTGLKFTILTDGALDGMFNMFDQFCDAVQTWKDCQTFAPKFQKLKNLAKQRLKEAYQANPADIGYNVLTHCDFQSKNLLHKKNSADRISETMLLDYQACSWGSPAIDLISLLDLIVTHEVKTTCRNEIIYQYHRHFAEILGKIGFLGRIPTLVDLQMELLRKGFIEVFHDVVFEQFKCIELAENTVEDMVSGRLGNPGFSNEKYRSLIRSEMPLLMYKGLLD